MAQRCFRTLAIALLCMAGGAMAKPLPVSLPPGQHQNPLPQAQEPLKMEMAEMVFVAFCLDQMERGDLMRAEAACTRALDINPNNADARKLRGYAYLQMRRFDRAAGDFRVALKLKPKDHQNLAGYGQSLNGARRYAAAALQFHKALALAPRTPSYLTGFCWTQAASGQHLDRALAACNRSLALEPQAPGTLNSRGLVYLRLRRFARAIDDYSAALGARPGLAQASFGRGLARLFIGENGGVDDVMDARRHDPLIDDEFISMGVLPPGCKARGKAACPPGFPYPAPTSREPYVVTSLERPAR